MWIRNVWRKETSCYERWEYEIVAGNNGELKKRGSVYMAI